MLLQFLFSKIAVSQERLHQSIWNWNKLDLCIRLHYIHFVGYILKCNFIKLYFKISVWASKICIFIKFYNRLSIFLQFRFLAVLYFQKGLINLLKTWAYSVKVHLQITALRNKTVTARFNGDFLLWSIKENHTQRNRNHYYIGIYLQYYKELQIANASESIDNRVNNATDITEWQNLNRIWMCFANAQCNQIAVLLDSLTAIINQFSTRRKVSSQWVDTWQDIVADLKIVINWHEGIERYFFR